MFTVNYKDPRPIYEQVKHGLLQMMLDGTLCPGGKLPSVREMAVQLAINPNTIQKAYRDLEAEGVICSVPGKGCFVRDDYSAAKEAVRALYAELDEIVRKLKETGISTEEICTHVQTGGETL